MPRKRIPGEGPAHPHRPPPVYDPVRAQWWRGDRLTRADRGTRPGRQGAGRQGSLGNGR